MISVNNYFFVFEFSQFKYEYSFILFYIMLALLLSTILALASFLLSIQKPETEKLSAYECGFEPYEDARNEFDIKFYLIAILFIVFDIETMFLIPWSISVSSLSLLGFWSMIDFIIELGVGFFYIWYLGTLEWS